MNNRTLDVLLRLRGSSSEAVGAIQSVYQALQGLGTLMQSLTGQFASVGQAMQSSLVAPARTSASVLQQTFVGAQQASGGFLSSLVGIGRSAFFIGPLVSMVGNLAKGFLASNIELETFTSQYVTFLGSLDAANARLKELQEINIKSPFELPDLVQADILLQATGQRTRDLVVNVSNAAAALGGTQEKLRDITFAISRIASQDFGFGFMRLRELAVANRQELEGKGLKFDANNAYKGTVEQAMTAINELIVEKFGGAAERAAETWQGVMSNIADRFGILQTIVAQGVFDELKKELVGFLILINDPRVEQFAGMIGVALGAAVRGTIAVVRGLAGAISGVLIPAIQYVNTELGGAISFFGMLYAAIEPLGRLVMAVFTGDFGSAFSYLQTIVGNLGAIILNGLLNLGADLYRGGQNIIAAFADGIISGAVTAVTAAVTFVANIVSSFLRGFSPPKEGPLSTIDKWFPNVLDAYLGSWTDADWSVLTDITNTIADSFETLVKEGKIKGKEAIALVVGTQGNAGLNQLVATGVNEIAQTGKMTIATWQTISNKLTGVNDQLLKTLDLKFREATLQKEVSKLEAELAKITNSDAQQALSDALSAAKEAVGAARTSAQQKAAKEQVRLIEQEQKRRDRVAHQLQTQVDLINNQLAANKAQQSGLEAVIKLREREASFMKAITDSMQKSGGGGGAAQADKASDAAWRYSFAIADNATKLSMLREKIAGVEFQSDEYYDILLDIRNLENTIAEDSASQAQARADAAWEYSFALADNETKLKMLQEKGAGLEEDSVAYYDNLMKQRQLEGQIADEASQNAKKAEDEAKRRADAEFDYQMKITDTAGKLQLLRGKLEGLVPGSVEYIQTQGEIYDLEQQLIKESEKRGKAGKEAGAAGAGGMKDMAAAAGGLGGGLTQIQQAIEDGKKKWREIGDEFNRGRDRVLGVRDAIDATIKRITASGTPLSKVASFIDNIRSRIGIFFAALKPAFDLFSKFSEVNPLKNFKTPDFFKNGELMPVEDIVAHSIKAVSKAEWKQFGKALWLGVKKGVDEAFGDISLTDILWRLVDAFLNGIKALVGGFGDLLGIGKPIDEVKTKLDSFRVRVNAFFDSLKPAFNLLKQFMEIDPANGGFKVAEFFKGFGTGAGLPIDDLIAYSIRAVDTGEWVQFGKALWAGVKDGIVKAFVGFDKGTITRMIQEFLVGGLDGLRSLNVDVDSFFIIATKIIRGLVNAFEVASFAPIALAFFTKFGGAFASAAPGLAGILTTIVTTISGALTPLLSGIGTLALAATGPLSRALPAITKGLSSFATVLWKTPFKSLFLNIAAAIDFVLPAFTKVGQAFTKVTPLFSKLGQVLAPLGAAATKAFGKLTPIFAKLGPVISKLLPILGSLVPSLSSVLTPVLAVFGPLGLLAAAIVGLQSVGIDLLPVINRVGEFIGTALTKGLQLAFQAVQRFMPMVLLYLGQNVPRIFQIMQQWTVALGSWVLNALPQVFNLLNLLVSQLLTWITTYGPTIATAFGQWAASLGQFVLDALPIVINNLTGLINTLVVWIGENGASWIAGLGAWALALAQWVVDAIPSLLNGLSSLIGTAINFIVTALPEWINALAKWGFQAFEWVVQALPTLIANLGTFIQQVIQFIIDGVPTLASNLLKWGLEFIGWIIPRIPDLLLNLGKILFAILEWVARVAVDIAAGLIEWGAKFILWIADLLIALPDKINEVLDFLMLWIGETAPKIAEKIKEWTTAFFTWIGNVLSELGTKFGEISTAVNTKISDLGKEAFNWFKNVGKEMVNGLVEGVKNIGSALYDATIGPVVGVVKGLADKLGIQSPSTVMRDFIGKNMVAGAVVGIEQESPALTNAVDTLFNSLVGKAQGSNDPFVSAVVGAANNAWNGMNPILNRMVLDGGTSFEELRQKAQTAMESARSGVETATGAMAGIGQTNADLLRDNLTAGTDEGRAKLLQIMTDLQQQFSFLADKYGREGTAIGDAIGSGMVRGLADKADQLARTAADTAYRATTAAKAALGIASPSKVFYGIGLDTIQGAVNAFTDNGYAMADAMTNAAQPLIDVGYNIAKPLADGFAYASDQAAKTLGAGMGNLDSLLRVPAQQALLGTQSQLMYSPLQRQVQAQQAGLMGSPFGASPLNIQYSPTIVLNGDGITQAQVEAALERERITFTQQIMSSFIPS